ncbi:HNH endonuclease signature motif containing protein [Haloarcula sp. H-GB4]|uniref:HNH endonuclease n=1 Tax=Haloarcula sp. H-GB4 TaxID=3069755 RepID=UPI0027B704B0|nr:HNH endonuclease signature motif containing protein [Haloarcula sp. H-GB4]MDQ2074537.1 HNH endonuclease signature motif containing protein [Haloarcula sp. H-GB4]
MPPDRLRSIVPMFGGATSYVKTLTAILEYVDDQQPTPDELIGWHRGHFERVSSRDSIQRRIDYLENVGFIENDGHHWRLGPEGTTYVAEQTTETLLEIMCRRNVGLRSLLYSLVPAPMTIEEIGHQQLNTHANLGWDPTNTDMAKQRANWLRSLGLVHKDGHQYALTDEGHQFVETAVEQWAGSDPRPDTATTAAPTATTYETTVQARAVDPEFRETVLVQYDGTCPISGVDHRGLLDVAHVLPWSDYPQHRADPTNVLPLSKIHHAAFDRELFTIDHDYRLHINPDFETNSDLLKQTIIDRAGESVPQLDGNIKPAYLRQYNDSIGWVTN